MLLGFGVPARLLSHRTVLAPLFLSSPIQKLGRRLRIGLAGRP